MKVQRPIRTWRPAPSKSRLSADQKTLTVSIPYAVRKHRSGKQIVTPDGSEWAPTARIDNALVQAVVRAHRWRELLETDHCGTAADLAKAEKFNNSYLNRMLRLTLLAPDIVESIVDGRQPRSFELETLLQPIPLCCDPQRQSLGFPARTRGEVPELLSLPVRLRLAR